MWEIVNSVHLLHNREARLVFDDWRRRIRHQVMGTPLEATIRTVAVLAPYGPYFPDFLTPPLGDTDLRTSIDAVVRTPRSRLRRDMTELANRIRQRLPGWARRVAEGDSQTLRGLGAALSTYYNGAITPYRQAIAVHLDAEYARRADVLLHEGTEGLLISLAPFMRWQSPVLHVDYPMGMDLWLDGRGLTLVPSFFCWRRPIAFADPDLPPTLVYPIQHGPGWLDVPRANARGLAGLIGDTRAAVLEATVPGRTTGQLADRVGVSAATASHHARLLREANLITSRRDTNHVVHSVTPLGMALLNHGSKA